ncbi:MAG TPA: branched-chain alpha-keto acid dehydrogenase subunit E2, partial [Gammaproteobacteria bacterium]|nr:branched-chain alpha-keto acid dehydrogenase subunit E2 [Gammaproteobacteria bacterium]
MSSIKNIELPDIGDFDEVEVIEILVSVGDTIAADDSIITLESDKASMEIPSPSAGTVTQININIGDKIKQGDSLISLESTQESEESTTEAEESSEPAAETSTKIVPVVVPDIGDFDEVEVIEILVSVGDELNEEDSIITLESDKASMEIPTPIAGTVNSINISLGDKLNLGDLILE